jgi:uncharacterized protein (DUF1330 family)
MVYIVAQLSFRDRDAYNRYQARFMGVLRRFDGRLLAADEHPLVIEGRWDKEKVVLLSFCDKSTFQRFFDDPEYKEISKDRKSGADSIVLLVHGITA